MPWAQTDPMTERLRFVAALRENKSTFSSLCAVFGIAPKTGYKWQHLFEAQGVAGLQDRSRRPHGNSRSISEAVAKRLVELRLEKPTFGPKKLVARLARLEPQMRVPAPSTVGELLKRNGLVKARERRPRQSPRSEPLRHADKANAVWSMDFKGWFLLGDGARCGPLTVTDGFSRFLVCCHAGDSDRTPINVWAQLERAFRELGMPSVMRVDNGQPWVAPKGGLGLTKLAVKLMRLDIAVQRIDPGKPYQNGRHERFHLTLQQETARPPAESMKAQQLRFDAFRYEYNEERPHEALGQRTPREFYVPSDRKFPDRIPDPTYPSWFQVLKPSGGGYVKFRGDMYFISSALANERVGFVEVEEGCFEVRFCSALLGRIHTAHPRLGLIPA